MNEIIEIEGLDGSGKATQARLITERLNDSGILAKYISYPVYSEESSALVKLYLAGKIDSDPNKVNPYAGSLFYACDRYIDYNNNWKADYESGYNIIADRYSGSNIIHQMSKLPEVEWDSFIEWNLNNEHEKLGLPRANNVIFLYVPTEVSQKMITERYHGDNTKKDIHECNIPYLKNCEKSGLYAARALQWKIIYCCNGDVMRSEEDIHEEVMQLIQKKNAQ